MRSLKLCLSRQVRVWLYIPPSQDSVKQGSKTESSLSHYLQHIDFSVNVGVFRILSKLSNNHSVSKAKTLLIFEKKNNNITYAHHQSYSYQDLDSLIPEESGIVSVWCICRSQPKIGEHIYIYNNLLPLLLLWAKQLVITELMLIITLLIFPMSNINETSWTSKSSV